MSMIRLELSNRDYNTIAEALLESALDWEHAADELGRLHQFCARTGDPAYGAKLARLDREQYRHRRLARRRMLPPSVSAGGPYWSACGNRRRQHHADGAGL